jgi:SAM-dependent methyltransferase
MGHPDKDLDAWMPRLIDTWRRFHQRPEGPSGALTPHELREVSAGVRRLSQGLTRERELAGAKYMDDPKLLGAYLLFYWPVSYAQARAVLPEVGRRPRSALDLGSGPGPVAFAAMDAGASEVIAADRSAKALGLARDLAAEAGEALGTREWDGARASKLPDGQFDLITVSHVLNELHAGAPDATARRAALCEQLLAKLKPQGSLLIVEPALRETSRALLEVRDVLVQKGHAVRAPCLWRGPCPALQKGSDWCHAERSYRTPAVVEALAKAAGLHKEALKMSYLVLAPKGEDWAPLPEGRLFRIVSEPLEGKGRARYIGCGPEGRVGLALQEKHRAPGNEAFFSLRRGEVVGVTDTEPKGDGLSLNERSQVTQVARPGEALPKPAPPGPTNPPGT